MKPRLPLVPASLWNRVKQQFGTVFGDSVTGFFEDDPDVSIKSEAFAARITRIDRETARAVTLHLELEGGYRLNFRAGQHVCVTFPVGPVMFRRHYALSSCPEENRLTLTIKKVAGGRVSDYVLDRSLLGQRVYLEEPQGEFVLPVDLDAGERLVMIAAGCGIAPIRALIANALGKNPAASVTLVYCCRSPEEVIFRRELEGWSRKFPGFTVHFHYSRREGYSNDLSHRLTREQLLALVGDVSFSRFYVCTPAGLTRVVTDALDAVGVPQSSVKIQLFSAQAHVTETVGLKPRTVVFEAPGFLASRYSVRQTEAGSLAEAAREAGVKIDQACTGANCKSCRLKVLHGSVVMDEPNGLDIDEARMGHVLACVAYPCEDIVLQLPR